MGQALPDRDSYEATGRFVTVNERVLLHLRDFSLPKYRADVPPELTQEGIAEALGIRPNHVPRAVRRLIDDGSVEEVLSHVSGFARRRKAYFLTEKGVALAEGVLKRVSSVQVEVQIETGGSTRTTLQEAQFSVPGRPNITKLLRALGDDGVVRLGDNGGKPKTFEGFADFSAKSPRPPYFFGRHDELANLEEWLSSAAPRVIIISGVKGIGKTALVHRAIDRVRGKCHIFWYSFHAWDKPEALLDAIRQFASTMARSDGKGPGLYQKLSEANLPEALRETLPMMKAVFVLDNLFELKEDAANLCQHIIEVFAATRGAKLVVTTRDPKLGQRYRSFAQSGTLMEIALGGLDKDSARKLATASGGEMPDFDRVYAITSGHPMVIELINSGEIGSLVDESGLTPEEALVLRCLKAFDVILG